MAYEIDFMAVGDGEKSGDAIALRFGDLAAGKQSVVVIDGGTKDSGNALVTHIKTHYGTDKVDLAICTHADADHASGLTEVLEQLKVSNLLMHLPWNHADNLKKMFKDGGISTASVERKLTRSLQHASTLEDLAVRKKIPIYEPFAGLTAFNGAMRVLGPSKEYYELLLANFDCTPEPKRGLLFEALTKAATTITNWIDDNPLVNLLDDVESTSPQNSSSAILLFNIDGKKLLFTGDAGKTSLVAAANYAMTQGIVLTDLAFLDVPHHGSKRNAGKTAYQLIKSGVAFISAAKDSPKHPAKKVMNALAKNGSKVFKTCGQGICHTDGAPPRAGWSALTPEPWHAKVEG